MPKPEAFDCVLAGQTWHVEFRNYRQMQRDPLTRGNWGICDWDSKRIFVRYDLSERNFVDTLLHELRHSLSHQDYCAEDWIAQTSTEIAKAMEIAGVGRKS